MIRSFPLHETLAYPLSSDSTVIFRSSLIRIPVPQMVSMISASLSFLSYRAVSTSLIYSALVNSRL